MSEPRLFFEIHGSSGPYLLLVHGMLSSRAQWLANIPALSSFCRPVVVELLGHGRSPSPEDPAPYSPDGIVEEFERVRQELAVERWFICGQSLGAALTLRYALDHPRRVIAQVFTNSMSALAPPGWSDYVRPLMEAQAEGLERQGRSAIESHPLNPVRGSRLPPSVRDALVEDCRLHDPRGIANTGLYTVPGSSVRERVAANTVPSLLIVGEREERFRESRLFAEEHMPHITVAAFAAGHAVNAEVFGDFNRAVEGFLRPFIDGAPPDRVSEGQKEG